MGRCVTPPAKRDLAVSLSRNVPVTLWQAAWRSVAPWRMQTAGLQLCAPCWVSGCMQGHAITCRDAPREGWEKRVTHLCCGVGGKSTAVPVAAGRCLS